MNVGPTSALDESPAGRQGADPRWGAFGVVTAAYLAVTVGESLLAPLFPVVADDLGLDLAVAGALFGSLTAAIAVGNILGGYVLARLGARVGLTTGLALAAIGAAMAAATDSRSTFVLAQGLLGLGAGTFFAPGLNAAQVLAGARRRGTAMGIFGVAFSGGLAAAALLAAAGSGGGWRLGFWVTCVACASAAAAVAVTRLPPRRRSPVGGHRRRLREAIGTATAVGGVGAAAQYGTVAFLPAFAVGSWGVSPAEAALILALARILSVPGKVVAGIAADRYGAVTTVRALAAILLVTGLWWTLVPGAAAAAWAAVLFAATVSTVFPLANLLAVEGFGDRGPLLGTYRSVQIGIGAVTAVAIGSTAEAFGLGVTLPLSVLIAGALLALPRDRAVVPA